MDTGSILQKIDWLEQKINELTKKQGGGGTGGGVSAVIGETPSGLVNGSNTVFGTATAFATTTLEVFLNLGRLTKDVDYTEGTNGFTMTTAPVSGDILRVCYFGVNSATIIGGNNLVPNEVLTGTVDGVNKDFYTANVFVANSAMVSIDGQGQYPTADYTEIPASKKITFVDAPVTGSLVTAHYLQSVGAPSANADTVDGEHLLGILSKAYPVGSIYFNVVNTNPATLLGFGTWAVWGSGRVPVGVDTGQTEFDTVEKTGGTKSHSHKYGIQIGGFYSDTVIETNSNAGILNYDSANSITLSSTGSSFVNATVSLNNSTLLAVRSQTGCAHYRMIGQSEYVNGLPPYITCYMWKRTA